MLNTWVLTQHSFKNKSLMREQEYHIQGKYVLEQTNSDHIQEKNSHHKGIFV